LRYLKLLIILVASLTFAGCGFGREHIEAIASVEGDHPIVGTWEWTESELYIYIFNADGEGSRGMSPMIQQFSWAICDAGHLSMTFGNNTEHWYMQIVNNVLTITSRQVANMQHSYTRVAGS